MTTLIDDATNVPVFNPLVGVLPHKAVSGMNCLDDVPELKPMAVGYLRTMMETEFDSDAHFCCYSVEGEDQWPRINKIALPALKAEGVAVMCNFFAIDFDCPDHAEVGDDWIDDWLTTLENLPDPLCDWCCHYTTKHGARLIYTFSRSLTADKVEDYILGIHRGLQLQGLDPDGNAAEWNRLFRCPCVVREGKPSWEDPYFILQFQDRTIDLDDVQPIEKDSGIAKFVLGTYKPEHFGDVPDYDDSKRLLEVFQNGEVRMTEWYKQARQRLRGRDCYDALFNGSLIAQRGSRDDTLLKFIGSAISMLIISPESTTPQHIYAIFVDPVSEFESDEDWHSILWSKITRIWNAEAHHKKAEARTVEEFGQTSEEKLDTLAMGMNEWCKHKALESVDNSIKRQFIQRHAIVGNRSCFFILQPDGYYDKMDVPKDFLIPRIEITGMSDIIETWSPNKEGDLKPKNDKQIINEYSTPVQEVRIVPQIKGGYVSEMDSDHSILFLPGYRRSTRLQPEYNEEVDTWLSLLGGGNHYDDLCRWISYSLYFEGGPICAMSISGAPGAGKKMIAEGLAECLQQPILATERDLVDKHQSGLLKSPFLHINEGWPNFRSEDISKRFRSLVGGDTITIDEKYKPLVYVNNPARLLLTANNDDMVQELTDGKDLSPHDRSAIALRLYHFEADDEAEMYLRDLGGRRHTGKKGGAWIRGDGTGKSDYLVAKHFLYLFKNRHRYSEDNRLLMHGNVTTDSYLMHKMLTSQGHAPLVIETIIDMIESRNDNSRGIAIIDGEVFVLAKSILDHFRVAFREKTKNELGLGPINRVLKNLVKTKTRTQVLPGYEKESKREWHHLNLDQLLKTSESDGHRCDKIRKLVEDN